MTTRSNLLAALALTAGLSALASSAATAGPWFQPPGSTEVGSSTFPDGSTNHEFRMPNGELRLVTIDKNGGMKRYFNPRAKKVIINKNTPAGGNPYILDRSSGNGSISVGAGG